jgi:protein-tyrosine phosphatase
MLQLHRILFVCLGNVCRSPIAEYLLRSKLGEGSVIKVESAGIHPPAGAPIHRTAAELLLAQGINPKRHRARQLTPELLLQADLVLVMEKEQIRYLLNMAPLVRGRVFLLDKFRDNEPIPDPVRLERPAFEHVYTLIDQATDQWLQHLEPSTE